MYILLHTHDEGTCSAYFAELKKPFPKSELEKYITLWKSYSVRTYIEDDELNEESESPHLTRLLSDFSYVRNYFEPTPYSSIHRDRSNQILNEVELSIKNKSGNFVDTLGNPGVYKNGKKRDLSAIQNIRKKLNACTVGITPLDEWNLYEIVLESSNNMYFFTWSTGA